MIDIQPAEQGAFDASFGCLIEPALAALAAGLDELGGLGAAERQAVQSGARASITDAIRRKVSRLLLLELNAARVSGNLDADDSSGRWAEFLDRSSKLDFWTSLEPHYPTLLPRLAAVISGRGSAALELARRFANDRRLVARLVPNGQCQLSGVTFGEGDSHRGGRSVALLDLQGQTVVYKPRPLGVDATLATFLGRLFGDSPVTQRIRVPAVINCGTYGWSEFIGHRYCKSSDELRTYYTGIGQWLALARLFGTTDLHAENLIACGPTPTVIDCETLFTPIRLSKPRGAGDALDRAATMLKGTVLSSGLLPSRGVALGWRGVDISAGGSIPGQQPSSQAHQIVDAGTDRARVALGAVPEATTRNLPSPQPDLARYWPDVLTGFDELTGRLLSLDEAGWLTDAFDAFADVDVRAILRSTEAYAELSRMLWHPVSLHDEAAAIERATSLLAAHGELTPSAPNDPTVIAAEVAELLEGDIPFFQTVPSAGWLRAPRETTWGEPHDVLAEALDRWRSADLAVERRLIQSSVVCAYLNDGYEPDGAPMPVGEPVADELDARRRRLAAELLEQVVATALHGEDGTVTWIAPVMNLTGWSVQPLGPDVYSGAPGVAMLLAGYLAEVAAGRARPVTGAEELLAATIASIRATDEFRVAHSSDDYPSRPEPPGLYIGLGSQIWCWTTLSELGVLDQDEGLRRAGRIAELLPDSLAETHETDLLKGRAGAIVALLRLFDRTADGNLLELATATGEKLLELAVIEGGRIRWGSPLWPNGLGSVAHGATGIGWALARLGKVTGRGDFAAAADGAFAFEESLWNPIERGWRDARAEDGVATAWCHGATGIGLVSADLLRRGVGGQTDHASVVRRAADSCWRQGMGVNHTMCHGDLGAWELLDAAFALDLAPAGLDRATVDAYIVASIEQNGPTSGLARAAFIPALMPGLGGVAYQLLRMDARCELPSVLMLD
ncbi:MAG: type 2 lanthipeptide synthetase LanM family protein [Actinomycetota bacterium]|nr:type 2 lanthipeptide synthetase LanM family protein [Actinomycetota bacterium]MDQ2955572.1 type 2 lanthipeptide synthetase LanM family protein [Actinomycetota bacterium]